MKNAIKLAAALIAASAASAAESGLVKDAESYIFKEANLLAPAESDAQNTFARSAESSLINKAPLYALLDASDKGEIGESEIGLIIQDLSDRTKSLKSAKDKTLACMAAQNFFDKLPERFSLGQDKFGNDIVAFYIRDDNQIVLGSRAEFPRRLKNPIRSVLEELDSPYKIKRRFDKDLSGDLNDDEQISMLLEMRYLHSEAKNSHERAKILETYGEILDSQNREEVEITWGQNSSLKMLKNLKNKKWELFGEKPLVRAKAGEHPSYKLLKLSKDRISTLGFLECLDALRRTNVFKRADKMGEILAKLEASPAEKISLSDKNAVKRAAELGFSPREFYNAKFGLIEYVNERHETVLAPIFDTDPENTPEELSIFGYSNYENTSEEERKEINDFYEKSHKE